MPSLCEKTTAWAVANAGNREESAKIASEGRNKRTVFSINPRNAPETAYSTLANDKEQLRLDALVRCCAAAPFGSFAAISADGPTRQSLR